MGLRAAVGNYTDRTIKDHDGVLHIESSTVAVESKTATGTLTVNESGKTFVLSTAGGFTLTLPAAASGLNYKFVVGVAPTTAYIILTDSSANVIHGQVATSEITDAADVACTAASDTITFVANKAIIGDYVEVVSDGTNWYVSGMCDVSDGITTTQAS